MDTTRMSSKGQVIIPKDVRDELGWQEGDELIVERQAEGVVLKRKSPFKRTTLGEVVGISGYKGPVVSVEEMDAAVDKMFRSKGKRGR
jgi:AbrB family looped-hinge helix DNA binding protein